MGTGLAFSIVSYQFFCDEWIVLGRRNRRALTKNRYATSMVAAVRRLRSHVPSQYLWPLLLLMGACFGCILTLLLYTTSAQDKLQQQREEQALGSVLRTSSAMVRHDLQDYAKWDDAVRHLSLRFEPDWIGDNVIAYLGKIQGYTAIYVLDEENRTLYSYGEHAPSSHAAQMLLGADFERSISSVRGIPIQGNPIVSGYARTGRRVFLYSTAAIVPLTEKVRLPKGPTRLLVIARVVDEPFLKEMAGDLNLQDVRLTLDSGPVTPNAVPIRGAAGRTIAWLEWTPHRPGTNLRQQLVPPIFGLAVIAILAAGLILRRGSRTLEDLRRSELRARHLSDHDVLTDLPNRRALVARVGQDLESGRPLALFFLDLDGFKDANDVYGHAAGDHLLKQAATRIRMAARAGFVARAGGDEFAVLLSPSSARDAESLCFAILAQFAEPFTIDAYQIKLGVSIGFVETDTFARIGQDELMRRADVAMYAAKAAGKRCARAYESSFDVDYNARIRLENDLRIAVAREEIRVSFQPIVEARTGAPVAVEALARWSHADHGEVPPDVFIPIAEVSGLIALIGRQVLSAACRAMRDVDIDLAVNLSPAQFWDGGLVASVKSALQETGFPPDRLELEITENLLLRRPQIAAEIISDLRALGIRIALDDFGTGFASIGYLRQLQLDRVKIDKTFIAPLEYDEKARQMLVSITGLAKACDLEVCAEGVETEGQAQLAQLAGCTRLQGWLFGHPQAADVLLIEWGAKGARAEDC